MIETKIDPSLHRQIMSNAAAGGLALLASTEKLVVLKRSKRERQLCLLFSLNRIDIVPISSLRGGRSPAMADARFILELPDTVSRSHLLDYINGDGLGRMIYINYHVSMLNYLSSIGRPGAAGDRKLVTDRLKEIGIGVFQDLDRLTGR